jgi:hypothetical protein
MSIQFRCRRLSHLRFATYRPACRAACRTIHADVSGEVNAVSNRPLAYCRTSSVRRIQNSQ